MCDNSIERLSIRGNQELCVLKVGTEVGIELGFLDQYFSIIWVGRDVGATVGHIVGIKEGKDDGRILG